jgi:hypothetical protein
MLWKAGRHANCNIRSQNATTLLTRIDYHVNRDCHIKRGWVAPYFHAAAETAGSSGGVRLSKMAPWLPVNGGRSPLAEGRRVRPVSQGPATRCRIRAHYPPPLFEFLSLGFLAVSTGLEAVSHPRRRYGRHEIEMRPRGCFDSSRRTPGSLAGAGAVSCSPGMSHGFHNDTGTRALRIGRCPKTEVEPVGNSTLRVSSALGMQPPGTPCTKRP